MKHNHHTAPRYYLKAFSIPNEPAFIWEYQRRKPYKPGHRSDRHNPVKRSLKKANVKTDYYGEYEDTLEQLEEAATPIIERLRTTPHTNNPTPDEYFLTSDNPVRYPEREGLGHELAFLTFPISTTITLFASQQSARELVTLPSVSEDCSSAAVTNEHVKTLNHLTITGVHQYLYSHEANEETAKNFA